MNFNGAITWFFIAVAVTFGLAVGRMLTSRVGLS